MTSKWGNVHEPPEPGQSTYEPVIGSGKIAISRGARAKLASTFETLLAVGPGTPLGATGVLSLQSIITKDIGVSAVENPLQLISAIVVTLNGSVPINVATALALESVMKLALARLEAETLTLRSEISIDAALAKFSSLTLTSEHQLVLESLISQLSSMSLESELTLGVSNTETSNLALDSQEALKVSEVNSSTLSLLSEATALLGGDSTHASDLVLQSAYLLAFGEINTSNLMLNSQIVLESIRYVTEASTLALTSVSYNSIGDTNVSTLALSSEVTLVVPENIWANNSEPTHIPKNIVTWTATVTLTATMPGVGATDNPLHVDILDASGLFGTANIFAIKNSSTNIMLQEGLATGRTSATIVGKAGDDIAWGFNMERLGSSGSQWVELQISSGTTILDELTRITAVRADVEVDAFATSWAGPFEATGVTVNTPTSTIAGLATLFAGATATEVWAELWLREDNSSTATGLGPGTELEVYINGVTTATQKLTATTNNPTFKVYNGDTVSLSGTFKTIDKHKIVLEHSTFWDNAEPDVALMTFDVTATHVSTELTFTASSILAMLSKAQEALALKEDSTLAMQSTASTDLATATGGGGYPAWVQNYTNYTDLCLVVDLENGRIWNEDNGEVTNWTGTAVTDLTIQQVAGANHIGVLRTTGTQAFTTATDRLPIWDTASGGLMLGIIDNELPDGHGLVAGWASSATTVTVTADAVTAPDGTANDATTLAFTATGVQHYADVTSTFSAGDCIGMGCWVKRTSGSGNFKIRIQELDTNAYIQDVTKTPSSDWTFYEESATDSTATGAFTCRFIIENGSTATQTLAVWGAWGAHCAANTADQQNFYPVSKTSAKASLGHANADYSLPSTFSTSNYSIVIDQSTRLNTLPAEYVPDSNGHEMQAFLYVGGSRGSATSDDNQVGLGMNGTGRRSEIDVTSEGTEQQYQANSSNRFAGGRWKYGCSLTATQAIFAWEGDTSDTATSLTMPVGIDTLRLGAIISGERLFANGSYGEGPRGSSSIIHSIAIYKTAITATALESEIAR